MTAEKPLGLFPLKFKIGESRRYGIWNHRWRKVLNATGRKTELPHKLLNIELAFKGRRGWGLCNSASSWCLKTGRCQACPLHTKIKLPFTAIVACVPGIFVSVILLASVTTVVDLPVATLLNGLF